MNKLAIRFDIALAMLLIAGAVLLGSHWATLCAGIAVSMLTLGRWGAQSQRLPSPSRLLNQMLFLVALWTSAGFAALLVAAGQDPEVFAPLAYALGLGLWILGAWLLSRLANRHAARLA